jgi:hypothetical protein
MSYFDDPFGCRYANAGYPELVPEALAASTVDDAHAPVLSTLPAHEAAPPGPAWPRSAPPEGDELRGTSPFGRSELDGWLSALSTGYPRGLLPEPPTRPMLPIGVPTGGAVVTGGAALESVLLGGACAVGGLLVVTFTASPAGETVPVETPGSEVQPLPDALDGGRHTPGFLPFRSPSSDLDAGAQASPHVEPRLRAADLATSIHPDASVTPGVGPRPETANPGWLPLSPPAVDDGRAIASSEEGSAEEAAPMCESEPESEPEPASEPPAPDGDTRPSAPPARSTPLAAASSPAEEIEHAFRVEKGKDNLRKKLLDDLASKDPRAPADWPAYDFTGRLKDLRKKLDAVKATPDAEAKKDAEAWTDLIDRYFRHFGVDRADKTPREDCARTIREAGFDIDDLSRALNPGADRQSSELDPDQLKELLHRLEKLENNDRRGREWTQRWVDRIRDHLSVEPQPAVNEPDAPPTPRPDPRDAMFDRADRVIDGGRGALKDKWKETTGANADADPRFGERAERLADDPLLTDAWFEQLGLPRRAPQ